MDFDIDTNTKDNLELLHESGSFKALDYHINSSMILRYYVDFTNFPHFINRWVVIKNKDEIGEDDSFITQKVAEIIMDLVSHIEEIEGVYHAQTNRVFIKSSKDFIDKKALLDLNVKREALLGEHEIMWYLFLARDNQPYLCANRDSGNEAIYELDKNRKFKPIHNAPAFDGFDKADAIFESIKFSFDGKKIIIK